MDGQFDSPDYRVASSASSVGDAGLDLYAAVKGDNLYVAVNSAHGSASDHFLFVTDKPGKEQPAPWGKAGRIWFDFNKPHLVSESGVADSYHAFNNKGAHGRVIMGAPGGALEGEIVMHEVFDEVPEKLYMAAVAYGDDDGAPPANQAPHTSQCDTNIPTHEFIEINIEEIRIRPDPNH